MSQITFFSNKTRLQLYKYFFVSILALTIWLFQISIFSQSFIFESIPCLLLLGSIYFGITEGALIGTFFGIVSAFFTSSILYDHSFYFSLPLAGLVSGFFTKNIFSNEMLFFTLLCFLLTFPYEFVNGSMTGLKKEINIFNYYPLISSYEAILNALIAPFFYWIMKLVTNKLKFTSKI